ncbi:SGNH/GDSL hydrolase family protein [Paenibacillus albus]|uniref:SGNH/GDSL hydrolase family protein n=1 Tax=Paenibacillus albus TaxID=2495582 RepID=A0A3Q8XAG0_9BACL|nr:SGNH/GDSL hydrolase family protein [Paenibacillus albus]AZN43296.1 SGNH/GDSL hydrolase family protein [Paenibacillus albus]
MKLVMKIMAAILASLLAWELLLNVFVEHSSGSYSHPVLGRISKAGINIFGTEGYSLTRYNSLGMRSTEIKPRIGNEVRVLMLGDSYTEGAQVESNQTFSYLTQKQLRTINSNVQVINGGRRGASPAYYIHLSSFYKQKIDPKYVVIQINAEDFTNDLLDTQKYFYVKKQDDHYETVFNDTFVSTNPITQKFNKLDFLTQVSIMRVGVEKLQLLMGSGGTSNEGEGGVPGGMQVAAAAEKDTPQPKDETNYEPIINWTFSELKKDYPNLVLLLLPGIDYHHLTEKEPNVEALIRSEAKKQDIALIDMRDDFLSYFKSNHTPLTGFNNTMPGEGHLNKYGHMLIADRLGQTLEREMKP